MGSVDGHVGSRHAAMMRSVARRSALAVRRPIAAAVPPSTAAAPGAALVTPFRAPGATRKESACRRSGYTIAPSLALSLIVFAPFYLLFRPAGWSSWWAMVSFIPLLGLVGVTWKLVLLNRKSSLVAEMFQ